MRSESLRMEDCWLDSPRPPGPSRVSGAPVEVVDRAPLRPGPLAHYAKRIAVRLVNRIAIVPVEEILRFEAEDNYVRIWADGPYLHRETLTGLCARLDPTLFLRIHRSHAVSLRVLRELRPRPHGEFNLVLCDGTELRSGRSYRKQIEATLGLA
jgi:two-component system LytT family response regulator